MTPIGVLRKLRFFFIGSLVVSAGIIPIFLAADVTPWGNIVHASVAAVGLLCSFVPDEKADA